MKKFIKVLSKPCFIILFLFSLGCDQASEKKSENDNLQNSFDGINRIYEGKLESKVTIITYESLTCGHCADFHTNIYPQLKKEFIDTGIVKIEFRHFPLDGAAFNASKIAQCKNDGKSDLLHILFSNQNKWAKGDTIEDFNTNLKKLLKDKNIIIDFDACLNNKNIEEYILNDRIEGVKKFKLNSTPTIIINNKKFDKPLNFKNLKNSIKKLI
ncbi:DsbA family protein [Candidatus Pelagibacter sp.]|nr:DsbA family protein [Candidatus Pelagibacter sp.]